MSLRMMIRNHNKRLLFLRHIRLSSCWACGKNTAGLVSNLFCPNCKVLQNPDKDKNFFNIMGVKETYDLDENDLAKKFKELQKFLHPDKYANREKKEQEVSEKYSSLVNEAYKTLLEPMARGIYMLSLRGKEIPENTEADQKFLVQIMEKNEEVENAKTEEEIMRLDKENKERIKDLQKKLSIAFFDGDLKRVTRLLTHMKYYTSIDTQIQGLIRSKGIYMLSLRGKEIPENTEADQKFLMQIMEKNEEVENAKTEEEIMRLDKENKKKIKDLQKKLSIAFFDGDLKRVTRLLTHMKYYTSIDTQIQGLIRSKGIVR